MVSELVTGVGLFKTMLDMAKGLKDINDAAVRNAAVIELQEHIFTAREQQSALAERVRDLEKEVARHETWEGQKQRYQLTDFGGGTFAYLLKPDMSDGEPSHRICAACYQKGHPSILQFVGKSPYQQDRFTCPACKTDFNFGERHNPRTPVNRRRRGGSWMGA